MNVHCLCSSSRWQKWVDKKQIVNYSQHIFHKKQCMCILLLGISSKGACQGHLKGNVRMKAKTNMAIFQHLKPLKNTKNIPNKYNLK